MRIDIQDRAGHLWVGSFISAIVAGCLQTATLAMPASVIQTNSSQSVASGHQRVVQKFDISVTAEGFEPANLSVDQAGRLELIFTRNTDRSCAREVIFPSLKVKKALPLNKPVSITVIAKKASTITFACGMKMFKGAVVVK